MTGQHELFGLDIPRHAHVPMPKPPRARATDPNSSHEAVERNGTGLAQQARTVLRLMRANRTTCGQTAWEIARAAFGDTREGDDWHRRINRRLPELERDGYVRRGPERACAVKGTNQVTWWIA